MEKLWNLKINTHCWSKAVLLLRGKKYFLTPPPETHHSAQHLKTLSSMARSPAGSLNPIYCGCGGPLRTEQSSCCFSQTGEILWTLDCPHKRNHLSTFGVGRNKTRLNFTSLSRKRKPSRRWPKSLFFNVIFLIHFFILFFFYCTASVAVLLLWTSRRCLYWAWFAV